MIEGLFVATVVIEPDIFIVGEAGILDGVLIIVALSLLVPIVVGATVVVTAGVATSARIVIDSSVCIIVVLAVAL